jgi:predicted Zn-dependent peptidase
MIADHVLGGHFYSRLYEALRHHEGDTYGTGTRDTGSDLAPGAYAAWTFTKTANAAHTEQKLREVLKELFERGISEGERAGAAGYLLGRRAFERQAPGQVLGEFLWEHWRGLPRGFRDQLAERAVAVPLGEVNALIRWFYDPARFTMVKLAPNS